MPKRDKTLIEFGRNVSRSRNTAGLSQDKLAEKADLDRTYLSGIERGVRSSCWRMSLSLENNDVWQVLHKASTKRFAMRS
jgi:DNA-binding XRE family transcriptional regulator